MADAVASMAQMQEIGGRPGHLRRACWAVAHGGCCGFDGADAGDRWSARTSPQGVLGRRLWRMLWLRWRRCRRSVVGQDISAGRAGPSLMADAVASMAQMQEIGGRPGHLRRACWAV